MEQFGKILVLAFLVVSLYDIIKAFIKDGKPNKDTIIPAILGIILALLAQLDLFKLVGIDFVVPYVGSVLTGFIVSKGSNYLFDFITSIIKLLQGTTVTKYKEEQAEIEAMKEDIIYTDENVG